MKTYALKNMNLKLVYHTSKGNSSVKKRWYSWEAEVLSTDNRSKKKTNR